MTALNANIHKIGRHAQLTRCFSAVAELLVMVPLRYPLFVHVVYDATTNDSIIIIIESYTEHNEKKLKIQKYKKKCIKHTRIDKSIQLTV